MNIPYKKPATVKEIQSRLATLTPDFGKGARRIAEFIEANPGVVAVLSAGEVAKRCDVHAFLRSPYIFDLNCRCLHGHQHHLHAGFHVRQR